MQSRIHQGSESCLSIRLTSVLLVNKIGGVDN